MSYILVEDEAFNQVLTYGRPFIQQFDTFACSPCPPTEMMYKACDLKWSISLRFRQQGVEGWIPKDKTLTDLEGMENTENP